MHARVKDKLPTELHAYNSIYAGVPFCRNAQNVPYSYLKLARHDHVSTPFEVFNRSVGSDMPVLALQK